VEEEMGEATYGGGGGDVIRLEEMGYTIPTGRQKTNNWAYFCGAPSSVRHIKVQLCGARQYMRHKNSESNDCT
jgi:hypothetical protein